MNDSEIVKLVRKHFSQVVIYSSEQIVYGFKKKKTIFVGYLPGNQNFKEVTNITGQVSGELAFINTLSRHPDLAFQNVGRQMVFALEGVLNELGAQRIQVAASRIRGFFYKSCGYSKKFKFMKRCLMMG